MAIAVGGVYDGKVTGITKFGAFVEIEEGVTGLVHISEVANAYVKDVNDFINVGDNVKVKVLNINETGKIGLSIKQAEETKKPEPVDTATCEDKLAKFMKDSNERLIDLKRRQEGRRGKSK